MLPIKCPQCGLVNEPDDVSFPRCGNCGEELVTCAACAHYVDAACNDPHGAHLFSPDRNVAPKCMAFDSRYAIRGSRWLRSLPAPAWVATILLLLLLGMTAYIWIIDPDGQLWTGHQSLIIKVTMPAQMRVGIQQTVEILVTNPRRNRGTRWYLELEGTLISNTIADMSMPLPEPTSISRNKEGTQYQLEYPPVRDWKQIRLFFRPKRSGEQTLDVKLYTSGLDRGRVVNARTIVVKASSGALDAQKEDHPHER